MDEREPYLGEIVGGVTLPAPIRRPWRFDDRRAMRPRSLLLPAMIVGAVLLHFVCAAISAEKDCPLQSMPQSEIFQRARNVRADLDSAIAEISRKEPSDAAGRQVLVQRLKRRVAFLDSLIACDK